MTIKGEEIFGGCVRLFEDGRITHWDGDLCCWRPGWGPWGTHALLGRDELKYERIKSLVWRHKRESGLERRSQLIADSMDIQERRHGRVK